MSSDLSGPSLGASPSDTTYAPPTTRREVVALALWTLLADVLIFRTYGFSGPAFFFALVPAVFVVSCPTLRRDRRFWLTFGLLMIVSMRLAWMGSALTIFSAIVLTIALAMSAAGYVPLVLEGAVLAGRVVFDGAQRLGRCRLPARLKKKAQDNSRLLSWILPLAAAIVFGSIFVFANPDLFDWVAVKIERATMHLRLWLAQFSFWELPFCVLALLIGAGLMRPALPLKRIGPLDPESPPLVDGLRSNLYLSFRNTLWTLIVLFGVYLLFEFVTLWTRDFPDGFYYAGYAHQGAAWLTFALALATAVLSTIFSGSMLRDRRLDSLRRLAWIWSAQNLLLALAVYNRLGIYVGYNGMTRMRTVGFFGITVVVIGFALVVYKIGRDRGFWWLIRAQLIALVATVIAYSVFPVDYVAHRYNAAVVDSGYLHPSVMIAVKAKGDEGVLPMLRLTDCEDALIREGVLAMLAQRQAEIKASPDRHWTQFQGSHAMLGRALQQHQSEWARFADPVVRQQAIMRFREYAIQWY